MTSSVCMTGKNTTPEKPAYAGDVSPAEDYSSLKELTNAVLVDVRTPPEWQAGQPDLSQTSNKMLSISWRSGADYAVNPQFAETLAGSKISKDTQLFFMCKGGGRSSEAAAAMTAAGYKNCFNIRGGFEGKPGAPGWMETPLPWKR